MARIDYVCPATHGPLTAEAAGLRGADGRLYQFLDLPPGLPRDIPDLRVSPVAERGQAMYSSTAAREIYRNFLDWLFATFREPEAEWRRAMAARLHLVPGQSVLVTGCGLGDDIPPMLDLLGPAGEVHAIDLAPEMIRAAVETWYRDRSSESRPVRFAVADAQHLSFADAAFDAAFHFGGINLFPDIAAGIREMARVVRQGGRVVFGDEGVAPWLRETEYGRMVTTNIPLWESSAPIALLPPEARDVSLEWVLGACFWVIGFTVGAGLPEIDPHVPHKGRRGGTMWTRRYGQLEGVTPETRARVEQAAAAAGLSVHAWLEQTLRERLATDQSSNTASPKPERPYPAPQ